MKQLSQRAENYLLTLQKSANWTTSKETVINYFEKNNFPVFKPLVRFQIKYSGLDLHIQGKRHPFSCQLFLKNDIERNQPLDYWLEKENYWFQCGIQETVPFDFYINQKGEICVNNMVQQKNNSSRRGFCAEYTSNIIYSSAEMMIEIYALKNSLTHLHEHPYNYNIQNLEKLTTYLSQRDFRPITECCDPYTECYTSGEITLVCGTWFDKEAFYVHIYGSDETKCKTFIQNMEREKIII